jgi:hypothetical protein
MSNKHICFYSNRCDWSKAFIRELAATPFKNEFTFVCVDPSPDRPRLPSWLKKVPTLVIEGEAEPRTDAEVMNWLSVRRMGQQPLQSVSRPPATSAPSQVRESKPEEPMEWNSMEMGGTGQDPYSFLDQDTSTAGNGGMRIQHSFEYLGGAAAFGTEAANSIGGGGGGRGGQQKSKKEEMFDKQMESYQREREKGMPQARPRQ